MLATKWLMVTYLVTVRVNELTTTQSYYQISTPINWQPSYKRQSESLGWPQVEVITRVTRYFKSEYSIFQILEKKKILYVWIPYLAKLCVFYSKWDHYSHNKWGKCDYAYVWVWQHAKLCVSHPKCASHLMWNYQMHLVASHFKCASHP